MEQRPKARVRAVPIFAKVDKLQLHRIATASVSTKFRAGEAIVTQGDLGDAMYIIEYGRCDVVVNEAVVHTLSDGDFFGELSLLSEEPRSASIIAASAEVSCMVLRAALIWPILEQYWCKGELDKRELTLRRVPLFASLARGELRRLATQLERVRFPDTHVAVISEGEIGEDMFVISAGNCEAFTKEHGRIKEYGPGDFFGELAVAGESTAPRKATVRTVPSKVGDKTVVECLRLARRDVARILSSNIGTVRDAMSNSLDEYRKAENLKTSEVVAAPLRKFWDLMVAVSGATDRGSTGPATDRVTREGYEQMHLRVSKSLGVRFNLHAAKDSANRDWAEDITAFSGDSSVSIWLEEVKKKFKAAAAHVIAETSGGWRALFEAYDEDGSGEMEFDEFEAAVRGDCNITEEVVSQGELHELFNAVDTDSSGDIDLREFVDFLESDPLAANMSFKVFAEAMQQLAQLWVGNAEELQHAKFLEAIFENITTKDGGLRDVIYEGSDYRLAPLDKIESMVDKRDKKVHVEGVDVNDIHSISGQTPAELQAARRRVEEEAARRAAEAAKRQAELDAAALAAKNRQAQVASEAAKLQALADAAAAQGSQAALTEAELTEIRARQKQQREHRQQAAKRRNGVLRSNAETVRDDFKQKRNNNRETISLLINGREKLGPDEILSTKGEVDPHILEIPEICLLSRQPLQRSNRQLYSVRDVTLRPFGPNCNDEAVLGPVEDTPFEALSPTVLSLHSNVGGENHQSPRLQRHASYDYNSTCLTRQGSRVPPPVCSQSYLNDVKSPRLQRHRSVDDLISHSATRHLRSCAATGVGNGSEAYRAMVEKIRDVAHVSKLVQRHLAKGNKRQRRRAQASTKDLSTADDADNETVGWQTERGTVSSTRSSARASIVSSNPKQAHTAREQRRIRRLEPSKVERQQPRDIEASKMMRSALAGPRDFVTDICQ